MATVALQFPDLAAQQLEEAVKKQNMRGASDRGKRRRTGTVGPEVRSVLGEGAGARRRALHAPAAGTRHHHEPASRRQGHARQHHRQSARDHRVSLASDLRGDARPLPGVEDLSPRMPAATCRRISGGPTRDAGEGARRARPNVRSGFRANTSRTSCMSTRWSFAKKACGIWWPRSASTISCTALTIPFDWPVGIDFILNASFLSNAQKEAILGGNLIKLLRITT